MTDTDPTAEPTVEGARSAAQRGELGRWVQEFLRSPGSDNAVLGAELRSELSSWHGPVRLPFDELQRLAGPPDQPALVPLGEDDLARVDDMEESLDDGWKPPPIIVSYEDGEFVVEDGNHRIEGLRRAGHSDYWSVVGFKDEPQRQQFFESFG